MLWVLALAVVFAAFQEARYWRLHIARQSDEVELARIEDEVAPVLSKRGELTDLNRRGARLAEFRTWRFQDRGLTMVLVGPELDAVAVIAGLQRERLFTDIEPGQVREGGLAIELTVTSDVQAASTGRPGNASG